MINDTNQKLDQNPKDKALKKETFSNIKFISDLLGIGDKDPTIYFQIGVDEDTKTKIESLIEKRSQAKKDRDFRDFNTADAIRDELASMGITIQDTPNGTIWEKAE